jgi:hypothetical protein
LAGRTRAAPVLVFFCGSSDLVNVFQRQLGTRYDFVLPDQEHLLAAYPPVQPEQVFPYQTARASLGERLVPLFRGLRKLREMGFAHIYLHDLVPQTPDDLFFSRVYQYACPARTRCKAQLLFNQLLAEQAEAEGFGLIQIWDQVTEQNRLRPEFALDSIHLNKEAAFLTVARLWEHMCRHLPAGYQPIAEQVRESVNEWALGMMQRSLNHEYHQTLALAESATDLMAAVVAAQTHYPEELTSFVLGLEALSRACRALGCLGRLPALVKPFQPLLAQLLPLAEPSARDTVRERWLAHAGTEQASTESNLDRLTLLAAVHELIVP